MSEIVEDFDKKSEVKKNKDNGLGKIQKYLDEKIKSFISKNGSVRIGIYTHPSPDPDAIGSQMGLSWLIKRAYENAEVYCYYDGHISHPQNQRMCNLLDPGLILLDKNALDKNLGHDISICVDTIPSHAYIPKDCSVDLVIDHHKDPPNGNFKGSYLNLKAGSSCSTIYQLIKKYNLDFEEDNEFDKKVATGLLIGIITDTEYQTSDDTTEYEHEAYQYLFNYRDSNSLKQITRYKQPKEWVQARACIAQTAHDRIKDGVLIHGIGFITSNNRDLIAAVADDMLTWENVETSVAFAIIDGHKIEGSVRSSNAAIAVPLLCKELGSQLDGFGGGKFGKGAYSYSLGSCSIENDMDDSTKDKLWEFINERELKRLSKYIRNES